jgi:error-prone DNA polymerase
MLAAGFTPGEADGLRRSMAAWRRKGGLEKYYDKIVDGMTARGYTREFAEAIFEQIKGFSEYGFPESHAASFALLVYASCWIKRHHPAEFLAALLNSQPLGFYSPSQLVQDARRHGVAVRAADVTYSELDCTLEDMPPEDDSQGPEAGEPHRASPGGQAHPQPSTRPPPPAPPHSPTRTPAVRLGLRLVAGLNSASAERIVAARRLALFDSAEDLSRRAGLEQHEMTLLAGADALMSLSGHRRQQVWEAAALRAPPALLRDAPIDEEWLELPEAPEGEEIVWDYAATGLTLRRHPLALLRAALAKRGMLSAAELRDVPNGRQVRACGIVTLRQQPETAKGTIFVTLEDETGTVQVIVWKNIRDRQRRELLGSRLLAVRGTWQREGEVRNLIAGHLEDLTPLLGRLAQGLSGSRDFH